jgi:hypothetical protein
VYGEEDCLAEALALPVATCIRPEKLRNRTKFLFTGASVAVEIRFMLLSE